MQRYNYRKQIKFVHPCSSWEYLKGLFSVFGDSIGIKSISVNFPGCAPARAPGRRFPKGHARVDQAPAELLDDAGQALRAVAFHVFRPADDALVGGDLQKRIDRQPA